MGEILLNGDPPIRVQVSVSGRAKRLSLRVSRMDGTVKLSMPRFALQSEARAFLHEKESWIRKHVGAHTPGKSVSFGSEVPFLGALHTVEPGKGRRAKIEDGRIICPPSEAMVGPRIKALLKAEARIALHKATELYADRLGKSPKRIALKDTRSRWGSCSSQGNLNYSWRLIMAPQAVLDYVAAHEVAHLEVMDHSRKFWNTVEKICPGHQAPKRWLKQHGSDLHQYQFDGGA